MHTNVYPFLKFDRNKFTGKKNSLKGVFWHVSMIINILMKIDLSIPFLKRVSSYNRDLNTCSILAMADLVKSEQD